MRTAKSHGQTGEKALPLFFFHSLRFHLGIHLERGMGIAGRPYNTRQWAVVHDLTLTSRLRNLAVPAKM